MDSDRNLLFGVLALQADLLDPVRFAEACTEARSAGRKRAPDEFQNARVLYQMLADAHPAVSLYQRRS